MKKNYMIGSMKCAIEKTSSGYYIVTVEADSATEQKMFSTKEQALEEILSYAEVR